MQLGRIRGNRYCIVEGRFNPDDKDQMRLFSGCVESRERVSPLRISEDVEPEPRVRDRLVKVAVYV